LSALGLFLYPFSSELSLLGGALTDGGSLVTALSAAQGAQAEDILAALSAEAAETPPGSPPPPPACALRPSSVCCLPFLSGERSPGWQSSARLVWAGVDAAGAHPAALLHAAMDGVAFRVAEILIRIRAVLRALEAAPSTPREPPTHIVCSGGALVGHHASGRLWARIFATALAADATLWMPPSLSAVAEGRTPEPRSDSTVQAAQMEATSRGLARFHGGASPMQAASPALCIVEPAGADAVAAYARARARTAALYGALQGWQE